MKLQGKTALVTGGGTGIGLGIALALAAEGCRVAICGRREEPLKEACDQYQGSPPMTYFVCDVADRARVAEMFEWQKKTLGPLDIMVNSAGLNIKNRTFGAMTPEQWDYVMAVNNTGVYNCMYYGLPQMRERKEGLVINISSVSGKRAAPLGGVAYNASKFAVTGLGLSTACEESVNGIRVTNIYPGEVNTPILEHRPAPVSEERKAKMLLPEDLGAMAVAIALLPPRAHVAEMVIKPSNADYF